MFLELLKHSEPARVAPVFKVADKMITSQQARPGDNDGSIYADSHFNRLDTNRMNTSLAEEADCLIGSKSCLFIPKRTRTEINNGYEHPILDVEDIEVNFGLDVHAKHQVHG